MVNWVLLFAMMAVFSHVPASAQTRIGSWTVQTASGSPYLYALTLNDSGHVLGQWCFVAQEYCAWLLGIRTSCEEGAKYPVLVNSDAGATSLEMYCAGELAEMPGVYRYIFTNFDQITQPVMGSKRIGFAIPLKGDEFRVIRFDLIGAPAAIRMMRGAAANRVQPGRRGTLDEKL